MAAGPYSQKVYYSLALDPIHIGMGGYRLGEVDLTIVREPGTRLPKIPGSSLEGASRAYTAMRAQNYRRPANLKPSYDPDTGQIKPPEPADETPSGILGSCAGKGKDDKDKGEYFTHCGDINCPVCVTYGFTIGPQNRSFHGMAQFYDAQILLFPVHSMVGPVWVTSASALAATGRKIPDGWTVNGDQIRTVDGLVARVAGRRWGLNLGWLFLEIAGANLNTAALWQGLGLPAGLEQIQPRLVLLPDALFSLVVNNNLEVRTSVSIDPATGAAEEGALFTYEALPRGTVLQFPVTFHNPQHYVFPVWDEREEKEKTKLTPFPASRTPDWVRAQVEKGLRLMEYLGVGGMNTRGFGRLKVLNLDAEGGQ